MPETDVRELVREAYGKIAQDQQSCCSSDCGCDCDCDCDCTSEEASAPNGEMGLSCGNPVAFSEIKPGDIVLDLGSGGGKDVFLAAAEVGPEGRAIGVDMTPEMLELARRNAEQFAQTTGLTNVEFREGHIEDLPAEDASVDLVLSNCVINLSPDKPAVFREVHRVLKSGGRMVVSDIVLNRDLPEAIKNSPEFYAACISGALRKEDYLAAIEAAGFGTVEILTDVLYSSDCSCDDPITSEVGGDLDGAASSITLRAIK